MVESWFHSDEGSCSKRSLKPILSGSQPLHFPLSKTLPTFYSEKGSARNVGISLMKISAVHPELSSMKLKCQYYCSVYGLAISS